MIAAALFRIAAGFLPQIYIILLELAGTAWIAAFALFLVEYAPCCSGRGWSAVQPNDRPMRHHAAAFLTLTLTWSNDSRLTLVLRGIACQPCGHEKPP